MLVSDSQFNDANGKSDKKKTSVLRRVLNVLGNVGRILNSLAGETAPVHWLGR